MSKMKIGMIMGREISKSKDIQVLVLTKGFQII